MLELLINVPYDNFSSGGSIERNTMISREQLYDLTKRLGLNNPSLDPIVVEDEFGHVVHILVPRLVWVAELDYEVFYAGDDIDISKILIAGARCLERIVTAEEPSISLEDTDSAFSIVHRCVLSIPPKNKQYSFDDFALEPPLPSLMLPETEDKVFAALKHLDFTEFEEDWRTDQFDGSFIDFSLSLFTGISNVELNVDTSEFDKHPTLEALWRALRDTVDQLNEIYDHPVLRRYLSG